MKFKNDLDVVRLKAVLDYDAETGIFTWLESGKGKHRFGRSLNAGTITRGYVEICVDRKRYFAHRLAWLYMTGAWPDFVVDHRNMDRSDNRWENLRGCAQHQNLWNSGLRATNSTGVKGVHWSKKEGKYIACLRVNGPKRRIGCFSNLEDAANALQKARDQHHGEFSRSD